MEFSLAVERNLGTGRHPSGLSEVRGRVVNRVRLKLCQSNSPGRAGQPDPPGTPSTGIAQQREPTPVACVRVSTSCLRLRLTETAQQRRSLSQLAVEGDKEDASHFIVHTPEIADHGLSTGGREAGRDELSEEDARVSLALIWKTDPSPVGSLGANGRIDFAPAARWGRVGAVPLLRIWS